MELSSIRQIREPSGFHGEEELSGFEGNAEETIASPPKLWRDGKTMESSGHEKKDFTRINKKLTSDYLSSFDLPSVAKQKAKKRDVFKFNETITNKQLPSMEISSMFQYKDPSGFHPEEVSSFDGYGEDTFVSRPKIWKEGKSLEASMVKLKEKISEVSSMKLKDKNKK